jgi:hypothetical protein
MEVRIATEEEIQNLSWMSVSLGNVRFLPGQAVVALLEHDKKIVGFAAVQAAVHAAGSWVKEEFRRKGHTYELRQCLDNELRSRGIPVYFAFPNTDFEKHLFAKYGTVTEHLAQVRHL